jgi:hypothetical protein
MPIGRTSQEACPAMALAVPACEVVAPVRWATPAVPHSSTTSRISRFGGPGAARPWPVTGGGDDDRGRLVITDAPAGARADERDDRQLREEREEALTPRGPSKSDPYGVAVSRHWLEWKGKWPVSYLKKRADVEFWFLQWVRTDFWGWRGDCTGKADYHHVMEVLEAFRMGKFGEIPRSIVPDTHRAVWNNREGRFCFVIVKFQAMVWLACRSVYPQPPTDPNLRDGILVTDPNFFVIWGLSQEDVPSEGGLPPNGLYADPLSGDPTIHIDTRRGKASDYFRMAGWTCLSPPQRYGRLWHFDMCDTCVRETTPGSWPYLPREKPPPPRPTTPPPAAPLPKGTTPTTPRPSEPSSPADESPTPAPGRSSKESAKPDVDDYRHEGDEPSGPTPSTRDDG